MIILTEYLPRNHAPMEMKVRYIQKLLGRNAVEDINIPALIMRNNRVILPVLVPKCLQIPLKYTHQLINFLQTKQFFN